MAVHFDKEQALFQQGVKVLTLYFIDEVAKYRDYASADEKGDYDPVEDRFDLDIFTAGLTQQDFSKAGDKLHRHIYDYVLTDSNVERQFVTELDTSSDVVVYAKLPRGFLIPTPVGDYNPDWAISFKEGSCGDKNVAFPLVFRAPQVKDRACRRAMPAARRSC